MHTPHELGIDDFQANRGPDKQYRTAPLSGLGTHQTGGFYHEGRFATLEDVVSLYDAVLGLHLTGNERGIWSSSSSLCEAFAGGHPTP